MYEVGTQPQNQNHNLQGPWKTDFF